MSTAGWRGTGTAIESVVAHALEDPDLREPAAQSTSRELFDPAFIAGFIDRCRRAKRDATRGDIVATAVALTAASIADAFLSVRSGTRERAHCVGRRRGKPGADGRDHGRAAIPAVRRFADVFFDGEAKEAVAFALLGYLHLVRQPGNLPSVTGARGPRILGQLTPA